MKMTTLTLQQYCNEILILQQHSIHNVLNGHCKVPAIFQKQLYKYSCNIARFQWNIIKIFPQYYGAMWVNSVWKFLFRFVLILLHIKSAFKKI